MKNDAQLFLRCVVLVDHLSGQCSYVVHNTTILLHEADVPPIYLPDTIVFLGSLNLSFSGFSDVLC